MSERNYVLSVGSKFPVFQKKSVVSIEKGEEFGEITNEVHQHDGRWMLMFWWPNDFTFVCSTEIAAFNKHVFDFADRDTILVGASTDSEYVHLAWRNHHPDLHNLKFHMLADTSKSLAEELGILDREERVAYRTTFIVDPQGIVRWVSVYEMNIGRNVKEVLRVLDALRTEELCPCNWQKGESTLVG